MTVASFGSRVSLILAQSSAMSSEIISHQDHDDQSRRSTGTISPPPPCQHLADFRAINGGARPFLVLRDCIRAVKPPSGRAVIRRDEGEVPRCGSCDASVHPRLYACVSCAAVSCHTHAPVHAASSPSGHEIAVDVDRAELFCCVCRDQVYDRDFDAAVVLAQTSCAATDTGSANRAAALPSENQRKRRRVDYRRWITDLHDRAVIVNGSIPLYVGPVDKSLDSPPWGLRGLNNLGNTCFMNSVLQALFHTPPLRNFFLSDGHNRFCCQQKNAAKPSAVSRRQKGRRGRDDSGGGDDGLKGGKTCLACDMDAMFSAVFSGDRTPHTPAKFLYSWWQHAANLASYQQQDAHEFFISVLDGIHEKVEKDHRKPQNTVNEDCCIAHKVFSGVLRSDVMCMTCGFTSTTYDPCVDISLDLEPNRSDTRKKSSAQFLASCNTDKACIGSKTLNHETSTLLGCLDHFTRPEKLGSDQKFFCQHCQESQESLKQMSIRKLPLVSCFHIKRFEHSPVRKMSVKLDRYLQFPFSLDMAPYLSSSILRNRFGNRIFAFDSNEPDASSEISSEFELFAVVTHTGKLDSGHYVTYLRLSNQWFKCDDAWVTRVNENIVRAAQGYMMFYVQKMLYYKASDKKVVPEDASG